MSDLASGKLLLFMLVAEQSWLMSEHIIVEYRQKL
jgi:hypothetical protein